MPIRPSVALDTMGGDAGPQAMIRAARELCKGKTFSKMVLVGNEDILGPLVLESGLNRSKRISILHTTQVIAMDEKPIQSMKQKKDSSMMRAIELVRDKEVDLVVSSGNTGSLMAGGTVKLRPIDGIERPALATVWPGKDHHFIVIDAGANPECTPLNLVHNAILGANYAKAALGLKNPRIGLLTIGTEEGKGTKITSEANEFLKKLDGKIINYAGPIEGFQVFNSEVDVVVCDGFIGNILLKTCESLFHMLKDYLKTELKRNLVRKAGAFLSKQAYMKMKSHFSPEEYGGAPFLGINGNIVKAHGSSEDYSLIRAIEIGLATVKNNMTEKIKEDAAHANSLIQD